MPKSYFDPATPSNFDIHQCDAPQFLKDYLDYKFATENCAPRTLYNYFVSLRLFLRWFKCRDMKITMEEFKELSVLDVDFDDICSLTPNDIAAFNSFCASFLGNSSASRAAKMSAVSSFYTYATTLRLTQSNPTEPIKRPRLEARLPRFLTQMECTDVLNAVKEGETYTRDYCILIFFLNLGIRLSELVKINVKDVENGCVVIHGKERKDRWLPLNSACINALEAYLADRALYPSADNNALFISNIKNYGRLSGRRVEQIVDGCLARAGLANRGFSAHTLRHTRATTLSEYGIPIAQIRDIMGHASIASTNVYTHTSSAALIESLNAVQIKDENTTN